MPPKTVTSSSRIAFFTIGEFSQWWKATQLALYFTKKDDVAQAIEYIQRARRLDPSPVDLILSSAEVHALNNRPDDAIAEL